MQAFEASQKEIPQKSKGIEAGRRQRGKKGIKFPFKGGPLMTRPMFATISLIFVALLLAYGIMYYPGVTSQKAQFSNAPYKSVPTKETAKVTINEPESRIKEESDKERFVAPSTKPTEKLLTSQEKKDNRARGEDNTATTGMKVADALSTSTSKAPMLSDTDAFSIRADTKSKERIATGISMMRSEPLKKQISSNMSSAVMLHEMPGSIIANEYAGRDKFESFKENRLKLTSETPVSTFSLDVDTASYAFVRRALNNGNLPQKDAVRIEELINYFDYDYALPTSKTEPFRPTVALYPTPWNKDTKLMHIGIKGHDIVKSERPRANLVFLLDTSGSMRGPDKLPLLKNSMKMLVGELSPEDTVAIVVYAGSAGTVLEPTKVAEKGKIIAALERLNAGGSTAGGAGIKLAYSLAEANFNSKAVNRVIIATDGDFNVGIRGTDELKGFVERKRETGVFLSVLGFGQGNYNDQLMQALAQNGNGNAAYIDTLSEARKVLVDEASSTLFTIAKDVKIQVEFNPERVSEYRLIGYESRMLNREDFNNDKVDAGEVGAGTSVTAIYEITLAGSETNLIDPLRYSDESKKTKVSKNAEYAFLKIRYKLPDEDKSRLITTPIDNRLEFKEISSAPDDVRFATSVAAFGQLLKGGSYIEQFTFDDVRTLAETSRGRDSFGYRSEFLRLIGLAQSASTMGNR
ncbi:MAG: VWA domain-containing protein [Proteobacteria bacterium]|nr:VWA domain-containing protein [Pseudomonadota bacterium]